MHQKVVLWCWAINNLAIIAIVLVLEFCQSEVHIQPLNDSSIPQKAITTVNRVSTQLTDIQGSPLCYIMTCGQKLLKPYKQAMYEIPQLLLHFKSDFMMPRLSKTKRLFIKISERNELAYADYQGNSINKSTISNDTFLWGWLIVSTILLLIASVIIFKNIHHIKKLTTEQLLAHSRIKKLNHNLDAAQKSLKEKQSELTKANQKLEDTSRKLSKMNDELNDFTYTISHDLRAPIRAINGFSEILSEDYNDVLNERGKKTLATIQRNALKMDALINDLLELSRLNYRSISRSKFNMREVVIKVIEERKLNVSIQLNIPSADYVFADKNLITQVWDKLISNAVKFSSKQETPKIEIGYECKEDNKLFWIRDNGVGFDPNYTDKLFKIFSRLHHKDEFEGTGSGLAIARKIIDAHGGQIWATSHPEKGATFFFTLPSDVTSSEEET